jgi:phosphatidylglycerophosphate synthase
MRPVEDVGGEVTMRESTGYRGQHRWRDRAVAALQHVPAAISLARLLAIPAIARMAWRGERRRCCVALAGSVLVDLADGIVARRVPNAAALRRQRALDGVADAVFFVAAPLCAVRLRPALPREERAGLAGLALCQGLSTLACLVRFGRLPRYRSASYKWCAGALGFALAGRVAGGPWRLAFRPALGALSLAHLEAAAITLLLDRYREPIRSVQAAACFWERGWR